MSITKDHSWAKHVDLCSNHLVKVEYCVGVDVLARHCLSPEFLHEEDLVGELWHCSVGRRPSLPDPVRQVTHKVEEEVTVRYADDCSAQICADIEQQNEQQA